MSTKIEDQPAPQPGGTAIWPLVVQDMQQRDQLGRERYGTPLQAHNGRDALVDAYQEALDLAVYLRQRVEEDRWIPVDERLPEEHKMVQLSLERTVCGVLERRVCLGALQSDNHWGKIGVYEDFDFETGEDIDPYIVLAWKPLPAPYTPPEAP